MSESSNAWYEYTYDPASGTQYFYYNRPINESDEAAILSARESFEETLGREGREIADAYIAGRGGSIKVVVIPTPPGVSAEQYRQRLLAQQQASVSRNLRQRTSKQNRPNRPKGRRYP